MEPPPRLRHEQRDALAAESRAVQAELSADATTVVFDTPEDLLRHDRLGTPVPSGVEQRLESSLDSETPAAPVSPWWRRWLGGGRSSGNHP
ncbi:MAG: hypothetical protein J0L84_19500 [Verrucomicrobia bacterium]|nr:hypothetical protein [Verrucomicrobiota bacterium]